MSTGKKIAVKFLLSNSLTGSLIGAAGRVIKELIEVTDARINVSNPNDTYPGTSDRVILLSGTREAVSLAQTLIWEMIGLMTKGPVEGNQKIEWSPRATLAELGTNDDVEVSAKFTVPAAAGGLILGKSGATIKNISTESGAKIAMSTKEEALFTQERIVTVSGTVAACISCTDLIITKLAEQDEVLPFANRGTTYSSPLTATLGIAGEDGKARPKKAGKPEEKELSAGDLPVADTTITLSVPDDLIGNIFGKQVAPPCCCCG
jgi:RNA-binding protein Nova